MNTNDVLTYGHLTILQSIDGLPSTDWETPGVCGVWSVKDIIAHLASFEQLLVDILNELTGNDVPTPTLNRFRQDPVAFNDDEVIKRQGQSIETTLTEYTETFAQAAALLAKVPPDIHRLNGALAWYGDAYDLEDFIIYTFYGHKREHAAQIYLFRDQLTQNQLSGETS